MQVILLFREFFSQTCGMQNLQIDGIGVLFGKWYHRMELEIHFLLLQCQLLQLAKSLETTSALSHILPISTVAGFWGLFPNAILFICSYFGCLRFLFLQFPFLPFFSLSLSGEFVVVNKHLLHDLVEMGLWSPAIKNKIIYEDGSVQNIPQIPDDLKAIYRYGIPLSRYFTSLLWNMLRQVAGIRTVWEIKQRTLVDMAVHRGCYIDQSQSLNIHMDQPNFGKLTSLHFYAWRQVCTNFPSTSTFYFWI